MRSEAVIRSISLPLPLTERPEKGWNDMRVCVLEKGAEVGAHILSGAVIDPISLNELIPDWKEKGAPLRTEAKEDELYFLTEKSAFKLPVIPQLHNKGNYIISLGNLVRWLGQQVWISLSLEPYISVFYFSTLSHQSCLSLAF